MLLLSTLSTAAILLPYLTRPTWAEFAPDGQNIFVYLAQSSGPNSTLGDLCANTAIDAVILGFVRSFSGTGGYRAFDLFAK